MGQKRSDLDTIPMCRTHHDYQHQVGWPAFIRKYQLDISELLYKLNSKPHFIIQQQPIAPDRNTKIVTHRVPYYVAVFDDQIFNLLPVSSGMKESWRCFQGLRREHLIDTLFRPLVERQRHAG
jgi:hypothetical protein